MTDTNQLAEQIADQIAGTIFNHIADRDRRNQIADLLKQFANEITRRSIEP